MSPKKAPRKKSPEKTHEKTPKNVIQPEEEIIRPFDEPEKPFSIEELKESISSSTRNILLKTKEFSTMFHLVSLSQKKKYGFKTSVKLNEQKEDCIAASLSLMDNLVFLPSIEFEGEGKVTKKEKEQGIEKKIKKKTIQAGIKKGMVLIDENGDYVPRKDVLEYNEEEKYLPVLPSSLSYKNNPMEIEVESTLTVDDILDTDVNSRYILFPIEGQDENNFKDLINALELIDQPKFLTFKFNYTANTDQKDAYLLLVKENGIEYVLMCVGTRIETQWMEREKIPEENMYIEEGEELELALDIRL